MKKKMRRRMPSRDREVVEGISFVLDFISFCRLENKSSTLGLLVTTIELKVRISTDSSEYP